jgi:hypothetical protein
MMRDRQASGKRKPAGWRVFLEESISLLRMQWQEQSKSKARAKQEQSKSKARAIPAFAGMTF